MAKRLPAAKDRAVISTVGGLRAQVPPEQDAKVKAFLRLARDRFRTASDAESKLREEQLYDKKFYASEQWEPQHLALRAASNRPCLTINHLPGISRQITNPIRSQWPSMKASPVDSDADVETADVATGFIRHIERSSNAEDAYVTCFEDVVRIGTGFLRLTTEFESETWDDRAWNQVLKIKRVRNRFAVFCDPSAEELDGRDMRYAFIVQDLSREEYAARYGEDARASFETWLTGTGAETSDWSPIGKVRIAHYYYVDEAQHDIVLVQYETDEGVQRATWLKATLDDFKKKQPDLPIEVLRRRTVLTRTVKVALISGCEILEGNADKTEGREWPGPWIPVIRINGDEIDIEGTVDYRGIVRDARGPSRMINFWASSIAEAVGTAPKAPYIVEAGQIVGLEEFWNHLNDRVTPYLPYKGRAIDGRLLPPPQRVTGEPPIQAMVAGHALAESQLRSVTAMYEDVLGEQGNERSGKAILARQNRGDIGASHFRSNFMRGLRFLAEQILAVGPRIYDVERIIRIVGKDGTEKKVMLHRGEAPETADQRGLVGIYDLSATKYDIVVEAVPSFQTRREESVSAMVEMIRAFPQAFPVIGDLLVGNMDWPGAKELAARLKVLLPPGVQQSPSSNVPPEVMAQMQQMGQQLQQLHRAYQQAQMLIQTEAQKLAATANMKQMELESRERVAAMQAQTEMVIAQAKIEQERAGTLLKAEVERITRMLELQQRPAAGGEDEGGLNG